MGILEDLMSGAKTVVDFAEEKTAEAVEFSKLKYRSSQLSGDLSSAYKKLGSALYSMMKAGYEDKELIDSLVSEIDEIKATLDEINAKLAERKDKKICPACNTANEKDFDYCTRCGNRFENENKFE